MKRLWDYFISDSQQCSAAAPNRLFTNYSGGIIHCELLGFRERVLILRRSSFFVAFPPLCWGEALCERLIRSRTQRSKVLKLPSNLWRIHTGRGFASWLFMFAFQNWITKCVGKWPLIVLYGVRVISAVVSCFPACPQEVIMKPSPCLPCSILQARRKTGTQRPLITSLIWTAAGVGR